MIETQKSSFGINVERCLKDKGPYHNLGSVPSIHAPNTRQIHYRNTHQRGINLSESEFVSQFTFLNDDYCPSAIKSIYPFNSADNRKFFITVSQAIK